MGKKWSRINIPGKYIRMARVNLGYTQKQLARALSVHPSSVSLIETDKQQSKRIRAMLARELGILKEGKLDLSTVLPVPKLTETQQHKAETTKPEDKPVMDGAFITLVNRYESFVEQELSQVRRASARMVFISLAYFFLLLLIFVLLVAGVS